MVEGIEKGLGQKMVVVNKPGGGGAVCASLIAKEKPDGYTIAGFPDTPVTRAPHLENLHYDPFRIWKRDLGCRSTLIEERFTWSIRAVPLGRGGYYGHFLPD